MEILISALVFSSAFSFADTLLGTATDSKGKVVYLEKHKVEMDADGFNKSIVVEYSRPGGGVFAKMKSDFSKSRLLPDTIFEDSRFGTKSTLTTTSDQVIFEEFKGDKSVGIKKFKRNESMVASQGFDNFLKLKAREIELGPVKFDFGILDKKEFYTLTGYMKKKNPSGELLFGIRASSWMLRLFANELSVTYEGSPLKLKSFSGRSNILDDKGESQNVTITYVWEHKP